MNLRFLKRIRLLPFFIALVVLFVVGMATEDESGKSVSSSAGQSSDASQAPEDLSGLSDEALREELTPLQYYVTRQDGTERAFANEYWDNKAAGIYVDVISGKPLFASTTKYRSGTGWPSFWQPLDNGEVVLVDELGGWTSYSEVRSKTSDAHLGHVFQDGPEPTGLRYCMNSAALRFIPVDKLEEFGYGDYLGLFEEEPGNK